MQLGSGTAPADATPRFVLTTDVLGYCRAIARRTPEGGLAWDATGDTELAAAFVDSLDTLAQV